MFNLVEGKQKHPNRMRQSPLKGFPFNLKGGWVRIKLLHLTIIFLLSIVSLSPIQPQMSFNVNAILMTVSVALPYSTCGLASVCC